MSTKTCPACGSEDIKAREIQRLFSDHFAGSEEVELKEDECQFCGAEGDFESVNDEVIKTALDTIKKNGAKYIIDNFASHGYSLAGIERALELPQRTLSKWRNDTTPTAAGLTLLKLVSIFPWLIEVADQDFNYDKSQEICSQAAVKYLCGRSVSTTTNMDHGTAIFNIQINAEIENHFHHLDRQNQHPSQEVVVVR